MCSDNYVLRLSDIAYELMQTRDELQSLNLGKESMQDLQKSIDHIFMAIGGDEKNIMKNICKSLDN